MCLFRWRGVTRSPPSITVMRASCRWPRTVVPSDARALEAHLVPRLGVGDVDVPVRRVDDHVEEDGADVRRRSRSRRASAASASISKTSRSGRSKRTALFQLRPSSSSQMPVVLVELDDQADFRGRRCPRRSRSAPAGRPEPGRSRGRRALVIAVGVARRGAGAAVADGAFDDRRGLVAGVEDRRVHRAAVRRRGQRARRVAEELRGCVSGVPPSASPRFCRVEDPDERARRASVVE